MKIPLTEYTHSDRGAVGYQVFGEGIETIVLLRPWFEAIDSAWDSPASIRMLEFYASLGRVVILDHRGFGVSDPLPLDRVGNLDEMTYDVVAVLDAVAAAEATVVATMAACYVAVHLAAGYPERVKQLALLNQSEVAPTRSNPWATSEATRAPAGVGGISRASWRRT